MTKLSFKNLTGTVWIIDKRMSEIDQHIRCINHNLEYLFDQYEENEVTKEDYSIRVNEIFKELNLLIEEFKETIKEVKNS